MAPERVQWVHLHPSKFANGCIAFVPMDDFHLKGSFDKKCGKKHENLPLLMRKSPFFEGGGELPSPKKCYAPVL